MGHVNVYYGEIWIKVTKIPADKIKALLNLIRNYLRGNDLKEAIRIIESSPIDTLKDKEANSDAFDGANDSAKLRPDFTEERKLNKSTHPISAQSQFDAPKDYDFAKPFTPEFRYLAEDIKTICQYLKDSGKITGPPEGFNALTFALAYHKDGQMYWAENLTEKDIRETIQVLSRQGKLHLAEETIIIHIKIHESKLTEEEAIRAQIGYILTTNNKDTYENLKMIADKRKELKENKESLSSVVDYVIETKEKDSVFPVPPKRLDNKDYWDGVDEGIKPFEGSLLWKIFIPGRHPSVKGQALPGAKSTYCLLCPSLRSPYDTGWRIDENWETKPNMYPIFKRHGMIIYVEHKEQFIDSTIIEKILEWSKKASPYRVIYNGRKAGATIPGHEHIQLVRDLKPLPIKHSPLEKIASNAENIDSIKEKTIEPQVSIIKNFPSSDNPIVVFLVEGVNGDTVRADIEKIVSILANRGIDVDVISAYNENSWRVFIIPRPYEAIAKEDGINPKTAGKRKETKVEVALDNLLGKEGKVVEHRTQPRVMAFVEFMGIFVAVDEEQYKNISLENFITVLNELGLSRKDATPVIEEIKVALEKDIAPQQQPRTPNPDKDINPSSLLIKRNLMDLYPEEILEMNQGFLYGHVKRATTIVMRIGEALGLSECQIKLLKYASLAHDIGRNITATHEDMFSKLSGKIKAEFPDRPKLSVKKAVDLLIEREAGIEGLTVLPQDLDERYQLFRKALTKIINGDLQGNEEEVAQSIFDVPTNTLRMLRERGILLTRDLEILFRYHNDYKWFLRNLPQFVDEITVSKEDMARLVSILYLTDIFEHGNDKHTQIIQRKRVRVEYFTETIQFIRDRFNENNITDLSPLEELIKLIVNQDPIIIKAVLEAREEEKLTPEDINFIKSNLKEGLSSPVAERLSGDQLKTVAIRRQNIDLMRNALDPTKEYEGYDILIISSSTQDEADYQKERLEQAFSQINTKKKEFNNGRVLIISVVDPSEGGQVIGGMCYSWLQAIREADKLGFNLNESARSGEFKIAAFHNGGRGERCYPLSICIGNSRGAQKLVDSGLILASEMRKRLWLEVLLSAVLQCSALAKSNDGSR